MAKDKVWDLPGFNSIQSVRKASCFDVLVYSSEEKLLSESEMLDYEDKNH